MARFGENYRCVREFVMCPLYLNHFDSPGDVYIDNVKLETVETIQKIMKIREERLEKGEK